MSIKYTGTGSTVTRILDPTGDALVKPSGSTTGGTLQLATAALTTGATTGGTTGLEAADVLQASGATTDGTVQLDALTGTSSGYINDNFYRLTTQMANFRKDLAKVVAQQANTRNDLARLTQKANEVE